jgi:hypothetical protein
VAAAFGEEGSTQSRRSCLVDSAVLVLVDLAATVLEMRGRVLVYPTATAHLDATPHRQ